MSAANNALNSDQGLCDVGSTGRKNILACDNRCGTS